MPAINAQTAQIVLFIITGAYLFLILRLLRPVGPVRHLKPEHQTICRVTAMMILVVLCACNLLATVLASREYYGANYASLPATQRASLDFQKWLFNSPYLVVPVVLLAIWLFIMKRKQQAIYGIIELSAALALVLYVSITQQRTTEERAFAAVTALYFIIRGLDNVMNSQQFKQLSTAPAAQPAPEPKIDPAPPLSKPPP